MTGAIMVAIDGSEMANKALDLAAEFSAKLGAPLHIVHVMFYARHAERLERLAQGENLVREAAREVAPGADVVQGQMAQIFNSLKTRAQSERMVAAIGELLLDRAARRAKAKGATPIKTKLLNGDYAEAVLEEADRLKPRMMVVGRSGLGPLKSMVLGSVSHKIHAHAKCTVVTAR